MKIADKGKFMSLEQLYISPFRSKRSFDDNGQAYYVSLEVEIHPTGIYSVDYLLQALTNGETLLKNIAKHLGCSGRDLSGLIHCLTGMPSEDFRMKYRQRLVDDLLRYTPLSLAEVAAHSGIGTERNLYNFCRRQFGCTPHERRQRIRRLGDEGRFSLTDQSL